MPDPRRDETAAATPELSGEVAGIEIEAAGPGRGPRFPLGMRYMVGAALSFSVMSLLVKVAGQRLPSQEMVMVRAVITLLLSVWGIRAARVRPWGTPEKRPLLVVRGVFGFLALSCFYHSIVHLPLADATVIQYTNPVWAGLLAVPFLGERLRRREVASVLVSMAGVALVMQPSFLFGHGAGLEPVTVMIGLLGAMSSGVAYVTVRKLGATEHPAVIVFYFSLVSVFAAIPTALPGAVWPTPREWLVLVGVGVTTQLGQIALTHGLRLERAGRATATAYLQIVFAAFWGIVIFAEVPDWGTFLGAALIVGSTLALARRGREKPAPARES
ncbi:DMT family transporter [Longimicrobium sp.]|uniref:DMT family transporter n=1 Tax=Longimicrobium sp. TaxID=2029185 RepID=UPI002E30463F|nr:DMT family transporter [Longimicrobium sp.]HEX6038642.1 DMT family transporter [Longimicrobium sp.]